jgi:hypothetical protein
MRHWSRQRLFGFVVVGMAVVGLCASATASASEYPLTGLPELGRCVKVPLGTGIYKFKNCLALAEPGKGMWEWEPGPDGKAGKNKFEAESGEVKLETVGGVKVNCLNVEITGEYTGGKTSTVNLQLNGCLQPKIIKSCQSNGLEQATIKTTLPIEGVLGFIEEGEHPKVGLDLKPKSPSTSILTFTCGGPPEEPLGTGEKWTVEGSVIGRIKPLNVMKPAGPPGAFQVRYIASHGKQIPEKFAKEPKDTLTAIREIGLVSETEQAGLTTIGPETKWFSIENEEALEIKAKV